MQQQQTLYSPLIHFILRPTISMLSEIRPVVHGCVTLILRPIIAYLRISAESHSKPATTMSILRFPILFLFSPHCEERVCDACHSFLAVTALPSFNTRNSSHPPNSPGDLPRASSLACAERSLSPQTETASSQQREF